MQFDVYRNHNAVSKKRFPSLLDVQAGLLEDLDTRVVVPLAAKELFAGKTVTHLMPVFKFKGKDHVAVTPQMAGYCQTRAWQLRRKFGRGATRDYRRPRLPIYWGLIVSGRTS